VKTPLSLTTMALTLMLPLANSTVMAGLAGPTLCSGLIDSVEILGASSLDARAEITCESQTPPATPQSAPQPPLSDASCITLNPFMIGAATKAVLAHTPMELAWETKKGTNWCISLELHPYITR